MLESCGLQAEVYLAIREFTAQVSFPGWSISGSGLWTETASDTVPVRSTSARKMPETDRYLQNCFRLLGCLVQQGRKCGWH